MTSSMQPTTTEEIQLTRDNLCALWNKYDAEHGYRCLLLLLTIHPDIIPIHYLTTKRNANYNVDKATNEQLRTSFAKDKWSNQEVMRCVDYALPHRFGYIARELFGKLHEKEKRVITDSKKKREKQRLKNSVSSCVADLTKAYPDYEIIDGSRVVAEEFKDFQEATMLKDTKIITVVSRELYNTALWEKIDRGEVVALSYFCISKSSCKKFTGWDWNGEADTAGRVKEWIERVHCG